MRLCHSQRSEGSGAAFPNSRMLGRTWSDARMVWGTLAVLFAVFAISRSSLAAVSTADVDRALVKARDYLYAQQNEQGNWEQVQKPDNNGDEGRADVNARQWGGLTAIASYALLAANESPQDPKLGKAINFLKNADIRGVYALGLRCQVWLRLKDDKAVKGLILHDRDLLLHTIWLDPKMRNDPRFGFYSYYFDKGPKPAWWYDHSVSQYGVLGMWALEQAGAEVPNTYWRTVDAAWRRAQMSDGGWSYRMHGEGPSPRLERSSASMTAAGIATLFITQDYMLAEATNCRGNIVNENIDRGLGWMDKEIKDELAAGNYYTLYGIERIGVASGRKYFSTINWYELGAEAILKAQKESGSWNDDIPDTCFAMLFLARGRAPITMNKLEYDLVETRGKPSEGNWNQRPRDVANFARWIGAQIERDLGWQAVNLKVSADDLHDSPILYIAGNQELRFSDEEVQKLRDFVNQGGFILGNADCGSRAFATSFQKLGKELFPQPMYKFRELEPTHPILNDELYHITKGHARVKILSLGNGVRELMLLVPDGDVSRAWQAQAEKQHPEAYEAGANIFLYACDKGSLRFRGESFLVKPDPQIQASKKVTVARLEIGENYDPEPGGWPRLSAILHNDLKLDVELRSTKPDVGGLTGAQIAHLTGTTSFELTDQQRLTLKQFVENGGTLIIDAAGGSPEFARSAEEQLRRIFGKPAEEALGRALALDDRLFHLPDADITETRYRTFTKATLGNLRTPRLKAIPINGRYGVFYSREDLTEGLVGEPVDGIFGYSPESATQIMRNLVLYASMEKKPPLPAKEEKSAQ